MPLKEGHVKQEGSGDTVWNARRVDAGSSLRESGRSSSVTRGNKIIARLGGDEYVCKMYG